MCILLSVTYPSLSVISCICDVEEIQNKLTAHFATRHIVAIEGVSTPWRLVAVCFPRIRSCFVVWYGGVLRARAESISTGKSEKACRLICAFSDFNFTVFPVKPTLPLVCRCAAESVFCEKLCYG